MTTPPDFRSIAGDVCRLDPREFAERFSTETACIAWLRRLRWPDGFRCPRCGHRRTYETTTRRLPLFECVRCRYQASPIVGTVFEGSRTDLCKWFRAMFWLTRDGGVTARRLAEKIGVTYKTAWTMLHKLRRAMAASEAERKLGGQVRVFDAEYRPEGGCRSPVGREPAGARVLVGWSEGDAGEPARVKLKEVRKTRRDPQWVTKVEAEAFVAAHVETGASLEMRLGRYMTVRKKRGWELWLQARAWLQRTFGGIGAKHRQAYWEEYAYRLNAGYEGKEPFAELVRASAGIKRTTYRELVGRGAPGKVNAGERGWSLCCREATA